MRLTLICAALLAAAASVNAVADWPQHDGPNRNGIVNPGNLAARWPATGPTELWRQELGHGFAGPAVKDGKIYLLDRIGEKQDNLRCFDLNSGRELWHYAYDAPGKLSHPGSRATPTLDDQHIYTVGPFGHIFCFDQQTHQVVWKAHLLDDFHSKLPHWGVAQSPLVYHDWLIIAPLSKSVGVVALDKNTGRVVWKSKPLGGLRYISPYLTTIDGQEMIIAQSKSIVAGVAPKTGRVLWQYDGFKCQIPVPNSTPIGDGRIFITGGYNAGSVMIRVTRTAGRFQVKELWRIKDIGSHVHNALLFENHLYALCNTNERRDGLVCIDLDGHIKWQTKRDPNFDKGGFLIADGRMYIVDGRKGTLHMLQPSPAGFKQIAQAGPYLGGKEIWSPPALSDGKLVIRDQSQIKCLDISKKIQP